MLAGGAGTDTYWFGVGAGADTIAADTINSQDYVKFYGSVDGSSFSSTVVSSNNLTLTLKSGDSLTLLNWALTDGSKINNFDFRSINAGVWGLSIAGDGHTAAWTQIPGVGNDVIYYDANATLMDGGAGSDTLSAAISTAGVIINLYDANIANIEYLQGSNYDDILRGSSVAATLDGGSGNDILWSGGGKDLMIGGAGIDTYWFGVGAGSDTVAADTINSQDYVKFYGSIDGSSIASTMVSGNNLTITLKSGDSLTLMNWALTDGSKLNNFDFRSVGAGVWALSVASDKHTATWTQTSTT